MPKTNEELHSISQSIFRRLKSLPNYTKLASAFSDQIISNYSNEIGGDVGIPVMECQLSEENYYIITTRGILGRNRVRAFYIPFATLSTVDIADFEEPLLWKREGAIARMMLGTSTGNSYVLLIEAGQFLSLFNGVVGYLMSNNKDFSFRKEIILE